MKQKIVKMRSETELVAACVATLKANGCLVWRQNSGGFTDDEGRYVAMQWGIKGVSDIIGLLPGGRFLAVEVKWRSGALRPHQEDFLKAVNEAGGLGVVVRSIAELRERVLIHAESTRDIEGSTETARGASPKIE